MKILILSVQLNEVFSSDSVIKNLPANAGEASSIPGSRRFPEEGNGNPLQYSCLGNAMDSGARWGYSPWGHKRVRRDLATKQQLNEYIYVYRNTPNMYMNIYVHMYAYIYKDEYMCR